MPIDDFLTTTQAPPLTGADLGVPDLPPAPMAPQMPVRPQLHGALQMILQAAPGILAGAMGPGAGTGLAQGLVTGHQQNLRNQQVEFENQRRIYEDEARVYQQQAAQHDAMERQRQTILQNNLTALRSQVKDLPDKAAYDRQVEAYANGLQGMGYRLDSNRLREMVPYVAPKAETLAVKTLEKWQSLPNNKKLLQDHPEQAATAMIPFDRDGDGTPELVSLKDLATLAGMPLAQSEKGVVFANPGTTLEQKANADGILSQLIAKAKAEGKQITPDLTIKLQQEAIKLADEAKPRNADPLLSEMRAMRIEEMKRRQNVPDMSTAQFNMANKLADDFTRDSKDFVTRAQSYGTVLGAAKDPSPAGDLSLIFAYMKMLDPGSVVREGEFATAQNTAGVPDRIRNAYNRLISGERLNPNQRADFVKQARAVYGAAKQRQDAIMRMYTQRAMRAQLPPEMVVFDFSQGVETTTQAPRGVPSYQDYLNQKSAAEPRP